MENFTIDSFITFDFDCTVFDGALTTTTISLMVNKKPEGDHRVRSIKTNETRGKHTAVLCQDSTCHHHTF